MKKCGICTLGSWVVGLAALAWALWGATGYTLVASGTLRTVALVLGGFGIGFLIYQPPLPSCPRCVAANKAAGWQPPPG
jgi:hypothetical protein